MAARKSIIARVAVTISPRTATAEAYAAPKLKGYKKKRAAAEAASHRLGNMGD